MYKNTDYKDTYSNPDFANVRYVSDAKASISGWAYVFTKDEEYVSDLAFHREVQVKFENQWCPYSGYLPGVHDLSESDGTDISQDGAYHDPNY